MGRERNPSHLTCLFEAISSTFTSIFRKDTKRKLTGPAKYTLSSSQTQRHSLSAASFQPPQDNFSSAIPAEPPTRHSLVAENTYPFLRALQSDTDIGDGLWRCCRCLHENILTHYQGCFPFRQLCCPRCNHIICHACHSSEILSPIPHDVMFVECMDTNDQVRFLHVCTDCGLSRRAVVQESMLVFLGGGCPGCGTKVDGAWPRYWIGSNEAYKRDPNQSFVRLVDKRADEAVREGRRRRVMRG